MKIGHPAHKPHAAPAAGTPAPAADVAKTTPEHKPAATATTTAAADPSATVALSSTAATLLSGGTAADFDAGKVAQIGGAIAGGTFKINPVTIADKLIANAQELLGKVKG